MKRLLPTLIILLLGASLHAQTNPNRLLVRDNLGNVKGFLAERVDSLFFVSEEGRVAADVEFLEYNPTEGAVTVSVTRTSGCQAFRIDCLPTNTMSYLSSDAAIANYFDNKGGSLYYEDFTSGKMSGFDFEFKENSGYSVITVGYDRYGIACSASRADFTTPRGDLVGNPSVAWQVKSSDKYEFTMAFTPNSDCGGYAICLFEKGEAEEQFNMWGPMFGFANMGDMIRQFSGADHTSYYENTWTQLAPGNDYEVYIQAWDVNGTYADMIIAEASTEPQGGTGTAEVSISIGEFGGDAISGYYQNVTFTPNDQVALYRAMLIEYDAYTSEWNDEKIMEYLKTDNDMDPYWDLYSTDSGAWNANPGTKYLAFAIGRNINGEWGPLAREEFDTPGATQMPAKHAATVAKRIIRDVTPYGDRASFLRKGVRTAVKAGVSLTETHTAE